MMLNALKGKPVKKPQPKAQVGDSKNIPMHSLTTVTKHWSQLLVEIAERQFSTFMLV